MGYDVAHIHPASKAWIYQSETTLDPAMVQEIEKELSDFLPSWTSHQRPLTSYGSVWYDRFVVIMVDQRDATASGCSMDTLTRFMQNLENELGVSLFNRNIVAYRDQENSPIKTIELKDLASAYQAGEITGDTLVFDNLVNTADAFKNQWLKPLKDSWHQRFL